MRPYWCYMQPCWAYMQSICIVSIGRRPWVIRQGAKTAICTICTICSLTGAICRPYASCLSAVGWPGRAKRAICTICSICGLVGPICEGSRRNNRKQGDAIAYRGNKAAYRGNKAAYRAYSAYGVLGPGQPDRRPTAEPPVCNLADPNVICRTFPRTPLANHFP